MKINDKIVIGILPFLISCSGNTSSSSVEDHKDNALALHDFQVRVNPDYSYSFSFHTSRALKEEENLYLSLDSRYDEDDDKISFQQVEDVVSFSKKMQINDFYLLVADEAGKTIALENLVIPTFSLDIESGTSNNMGNDILSFSYLENGYDSSNFFDDGGITIYRSDTYDFSLDESKIVLKDQTISDEFIISNEKNEPYYKLAASFGSGKGVYVSQTFRKDVRFGTDILSVSSIDMEKKDDKVAFDVKGDLQKSVSDLDLLFINSKENKSYYQPMRIENMQFQSSALLSLGQGVYKAYFSLNSGIYFPIDYAIVEGTERRKIYADDSFYSFCNEDGQLGIHIQGREKINIVSCRLDKSEEGVSTLSVEGYFDKSKFSVDPSTGEQMTVFEPSLGLLSDDFAQQVYYPLTIDGNHFSVKADLSVLNRLGKWYSIKLWFNTTRIVDADGISSMVNSATYEMQVSDADSFSQKIKTDNMVVYQYQSYLDNLKLEIKDYSASVSSWEYVLINSRMFLRLKGTFYHGASYFDVYAGSDSDHHTADVIVDENHEFVTDIDIGDITSYVNYGVHWIGEEFGDNEITTDYLKKPHAILSDRSGYIYSVKQETLGKTKYFKVYKDIDSAKASDIDFSSDSDSVFANVYGYVNADLSQENLYLQLGELSFYGDGNSNYGDISYFPLSIGEDLSFSCKVDVSSMKKEAYYQLKLVYKKDNSVEDVTTEKTTFCGFYTEYLPTNYGSKALSTKQGTYRIRNFGGLNGHWEIYLILI